MTRCHVQLWSPCNVFSLLPLWQKSSSYWSTWGLYGAHMSPMSAHMGVSLLLGAPQKLTKNRPKMLTRKSAVSTQNKPFGDLWSSRTASHRKTGQFELVEIFRAPTGTLFVPILSPNMSSKFLAVRFFTQPPRPSKENPHESCLMMHHG